MSGESFEDIEGGFAIDATRDAWDTVRKDIFEDFQNENVSLKKGRVIDIAIAVGLTEGERGAPGGDDPYRTSVDSVDQKDILKTLIEIRHPDADSERLQELMEEYFEGGLQYIAEAIEDDGYFDYNQYLPDEITDIEL